MSATTNGASLEDCLTNIFSLIDLNGIRWKRFKAKEGGPAHQHTTTTTTNNNNHINHNQTAQPIDTHPILSAYAKCIDENHIAVWRQEPQKRHNSSGSTPGGAPGAAGGTTTGRTSASHSNYPTPTRASNNNTPTGGAPAQTVAGGQQQQQQQSGNNQQQSSANNPANSPNYELWIFGYGHQLRVDNVVGDELVEVEDDTWESKGLSYECRMLLFKALHNLIERCLMNKGFTRIGRWFVQALASDNHSHLTFFNLNNNLYTNTNYTKNSTKPLKQPKLEQNNQQTSSISGGNKNTLLASKVSSTINRIIDSRRDAFESRHCRETNNRSDGLRHTTTRSQSSYFTSSLDGIKSSSSFAFSFFVHGDSTVCATVDVRQHPLVHPITKHELNASQEGNIIRVALAPFGLNGVLNGVSYKDSDNGAATTAFIQQWSKFYPLPKTLARLVPASTTTTTPSNVPPATTVPNAAGLKSQAPTNSAINPSSFNPRTPSSSSSATNAAPTTPNSNQPYSSTNTGTTNTATSNPNAEGSRLCLSNLTNMLLPPTHKPVLNFLYDPNEVPPVVEVIVAGFRMRWPSECVFTTSKVLDLYKSPSIPSISKTISSLSNKRPNRTITHNNNSSKQNRLSLLSEKLNEDKSTHFQAKIRTESVESSEMQRNFNTPFKLSPPDSNSSNNKQPTTRPDEISSNNFNKQNNDSFKDKTCSAPNGCVDQDSSAINSNPFPSAQTTLSSANLPSRYGSSKTPYGSTNTPLGLTDLVKLFPTPPSLEQIIPSPMTVGGEDSSNPKDSSVPSPNVGNRLTDAKDNGIDVYKPVEFALMPPPPKWAALTNIIISSSKSLPPECIYKGSSQKNSTKNITSKFGDVNQMNTLKTNSTTAIQYPSSYSDRQPHSNSHTIPPLTDQTNKNGINSPNLNTSTEHTFTTSRYTSFGATSILNQNNQSPHPNLIHNTVPSPSANPASALASTTQTTTLTSSSGNIFSSFTLPHQRLFNNLHEINSIQLSLLISDSALGMFKDHNFESCTLCVCNMSIKGTQGDTLPQKADISLSWRPPTTSDNILSNSSFSEFVNECTCGFSAITNRHNSHLSGLFLEDELELTNVLYDPTEMIDQNKFFRKLRLASYSESSISEEQKLLTQLLESNMRIIKKEKMDPEDSKNVMKNLLTRDNRSSSQSSHNTNDDTKIFVIDQLKQQCSTMMHLNSSLSKVLLIESFRNNRHLTTCSNYYAQTSHKPVTGSLFQRFFDDSNKYTTVRMLNRNPLSLKFSDFCELTKSLIMRLNNQIQSSGQRLPNNNLMKSSSGISELSSIFIRMFSPMRQSTLIGKSGELKSTDRNSILNQGLQSLVIPTLSIDPKGALQMLESLIKEESKEALATLNKAILIFSSPIHDWQFLTAPMPENNFDVANLLKLIQPSLEESIGSHNRLYKDFIHQQQQHIFSARDSPTGAPTLPTPPCQGPLTWRQFHQAAGRGTEDQCEPQPIPSLLVGHQVEKNHLAVSPFALKFWDKLLLEPYATSHNLFYLIIAQDDSNIIPYINSFFKEMSNVYELMKLGKHAPIGTGLVLASLGSSENLNEEDDTMMFKMSKLERDLCSQILLQLKSYMSKLSPALAKSIVDFLEERQAPQDHYADRFDSSTEQQVVKPRYTMVSSKVIQNSSQQNFSESSFGSGHTSNTQSQDPSSFGGNNPTTNNPSAGANFDSNNSSQQTKSQNLLSSASHNNEQDNIYQEDEANKLSGIVIYMIDPFSSPSFSQNHRTLATIGLMKCYSALLDNLPEPIRRITQLQLISIDSITSHSRLILDITKADRLKSLAMNVYSRCRKILTNQQTAKSLTGFGPSAALENFFKTKSPDSFLTKVFTPPFILAPMKDKQTELGEMYGDRREKSCVMFCSYCITEDQRWLLASITNDKGEMSETTVININIIDKLKKPKISIKRIALRKLMDFIISVMSEWVNPWRLIIGKMGRVGHGELKEWATLMSKRSLLNYSRHLTERCRQCQIIPPMETVSILSACLVSLEPDTKLRIMPDQFTSDDRQASFNKCPLSTPEDASATHILVFPTSASIQSSHGNVEDPLAGSGLDDDMLNQFPLEDGIEELGVEDNLDDIFGMSWDDNTANVADSINSHHDTMMSNNSLPMELGSANDTSNNQDEILQLLQQPLALGYYISTAKIGQMPNWFWATSPHLRNSCPVFLKSALHIHVPCVHLSDDLLHSSVGHSRKSHQLDSNLTTDVLRYVLEGYNSLSWLALNPRTYDRQSCLPVHMQNLLQLYHLMESFS